MKFVALVTEPSWVVTTIVPVVAFAGTVTIRLVALSVLIVADSPLSVTLIAPSRFVPLIVTVVPTGPEVGLKLVIVGGPSIVTVVTAYEIVPFAAADRVKVNEPPVA